MATKKAPVKKTNSRSGIDQARDTNSSKKAGASKKVKATKGGTKKTRDPQ